LIEAVVAEQNEMRERAKQFEDDPGLVQSILLEGSEKARDVARETLEDVRAAIGLSHK
jgi:tryptophanyl-tRNA synthetase